MAVGAAPAAHSIAGRLIDLGARYVRSLATFRGIGRLDEGIESRIIVVTAGTNTQAIRALERALDAPPADVCAWLDDWDPECSARVVRNIFSTGEPIAGRCTWGARPRTWQALEDKTIIDALWDAVGIPRAPALNAPVDAEALARAAQRLDRGQGPMLSTPLVSTL